MKFRLALLGLTGLVAPLAAHAQPVEGLYIGGGAGFDYLNNLNGKRIVFPVPTVAGVVTPTFPVQSGSFHSNGGFVGVGSVGYGLGNGLRFEVEGDYRQNHTRVKNSSTLGGGGDIQQYGAMGNVLYDIDAGLGYVFPYIGVGVGYQENSLSGMKVYTTAPTIIPGQLGINFTNSAKGSAAAQAILGASFPLTYALSLTTEFRFIGQFSQQTFHGGATYNGSRDNVAGASLKLAAPTNESFLVGLRYSFDAAPPAPPPAPAPVAGPTPAPAKTYLVFFDWDKYDLTDRAKQIIAEAATNSTKVQVTTIQVNGYTDLSGTPAYNLKLSVRRADAVKAELIKNGVPAGIIQTHGYGMENPLVPTALGVREPQNRRVEIIFK